MDERSFELQVMEPNAALASFVESYWLLTNHSQEEREVIILPDGRIDLSFTPQFGVSLLGLETGPSQTKIPANCTMFSISFKPPAVEYLFSRYAPILPNTAIPMPTGFAGLRFDPQKSFEENCKYCEAVLCHLLNKEVDERKKNLFDLVIASEGTISIEDVSQKVFWSSRQINRYCKQMIGIPLKTYCSILRFRASFPQIKAGKLFPMDHFSDQSHFIREIKKFAGAIPKELSRNQNDRFIQFSTLPKQ